MAKAKLVLATTNKGKVKEMVAILKDVDVELLSLSDFPDMPEVDEDGDTFEANARKKATEVARFTGLCALADDSGLEVDALDGRPGVLSARFSGPGATDSSNRQLLLELMSDVPDSERTARFRCVIAVADTDGTYHYESGACEGRINHVGKGDDGFGYDPLFESQDLGWRTFAEVPSADKNTISHRARALEKIKPYLVRMFS